MQDKRTLLAQELAKECKTVEDVHNMLKDLFKRTIEEVLESEITNHLVYEKHSSQGINSGNSRNSYSTKTLKTQMGETEINIPRDRNGEFEPQIIKKYEKNASELENQIIAKYAKGMSTRDIENHLRDIYGVDVSAGLISRVTDKIMPLVAEWQARPLERIYAIVYLDAIHFKVRKDNRIINKAAYSILGISLSGHKDVLGIWVGETESASFWLSVCNDLKARGIEDILIVAKDGLAGFSEAINTVFPQTDIQLCVIHQIRNSLKYVSYKDQKLLMADLKNVYQALTLEEAMYNSEEFKKKWGKKYPLVIRSRETHWDELTTYFRYPVEIRRIIYTTNLIEGYHRQLRKVTKTKTAYPTDEALRNIVYLATMDISKKWTMPIKDWNNVLAQFILYYGDRLTEKMAI